MTTDHLDTKPVATALGLLLAHLTVQSARLNKVMVLDCLKGNSKRVYFRDSSRLAADLKVVQPLKTGQLLAHFMRPKGAADTQEFIHSLKAATTAVKFFPSRADCGWFDPGIAQPIRSVAICLGTGETGKAAGVDS